MNRAVILVGAAAIDALAGEPPNAVHPVVWMGKALSAVDPLVRRGNRGRQLLAGSIVGSAGPLLAAGAGSAISRIAARSHWFVPAEAWFLKCCFAWRSLDRAAERVETALSAGDLVAAREALGWLVSRDTSTLDAPLIAAAAIESVAENFADSLVAPTLAFAGGGMAGAFAYRWSNTADAMYGYRGEREWSGKAAARIDDAANLVPSRIAAALLLAAEPQAARAALLVTVRDSGKTESPNAGWPMAAMAGLLDRRLEKVGVYVLHESGTMPTAADIRKARDVMRRSWLIWLSLLTGWLLFRK